MIDSFITLNIRILLLLDKCHGFDDNMSFTIFHVFISQIREQEISILIYGGNSIIIASSLYIQWQYASGNHRRLVDENLDPNIKTTLSRSYYLE
jgi:hypothetical protein